MFHIGFLFVLQVSHRHLSLRFRLETRKWKLAINVLQAVSFATYIKERLINISGACELIWSRKSSRFLRAVPEMLAVKIDGLPVAEKLNWVTTFIRIIDWKFFKNRISAQKNPLVIGDWKLSCFSFNSRRSDCETAVAGNNTRINTQKTESKVKSMF